MESREGGHHAGQEPHMQRRLHNLAPLFRAPCCPQPMGAAAVEPGDTTDIVVPAECSTQRSWFTAASPVPSQLSCPHAGEEPHTHAVS